MRTATVENSASESSVSHVPLSTLRRGESARVLGLTGDLPPALCLRLADLGFVGQTPVLCLRRAPLGSPVVYCVGETELCLRADLARCVLVERSP
jgi:Fe2+ transport system protein FeoA